jgi:hypothetical protein
MKAFFGNMFDNCYEYTKNTDCNNIHDNFTKFIDKLNTCIFKDIHSTSNTFNEEVDKIIECCPNVKIFFSALTPCVNELIRINNSEKFKSTTYDIPSIVIGTKIRHVPAFNEKGEINNHNNNYIISTTVISKSQIVLYNKTFENSRYSFEELLFNLKCPLLKPYYNPYYNYPKNSSINPEQQTLRQQEENDISAQYREQSARIKAEYETMKEQEKLRKEQEKLRKEQEKHRKEQEIKSIINNVKIDRIDTKSVIEDFEYDLDKSYSNINDTFVEINLRQHLIINNFYVSESASHSIFLEGTLQNQEVFCKFFDIRHNSLMFEKNIYKFINAFSNENQKFKETIEQHVIQACDIIYTNALTLKNYYNSIFYINRSEFNDKFDSLGLQYSNILCGIITPKYPNKQNVFDKLAYDLLQSDLNTLTRIVINDTNPYTQTYVSEININMNKYKIIQIIFSVLYSIYLLHMKLDIMHNDNHLDNIMYYDTDEFTKTYLLGNQIIHSVENFTTRIFDFDKSTKTHTHSNYKQYDNTYIDGKECQITGSCNKHNQKDVFVICDSLIHIAIELEKRPHIDTTFISSVIKNLINNPHLSIAILEHIITTNDPIPRYFEIDEHNQKFISNTGSTADYPDLEITTVLNRFIQKYTRENLLFIKVKNKRGIIEYKYMKDIESHNIDDIAFKKYLKYKNKYIKLKK